MKTTTYKPIDCNVYDVLVAYAMKKKTVDITYQNSVGQKEEVSAQIKDIFTKEKEEFVLLDNEQVIRLDNLQKVDKQDIAGNYCSV